MKTESARMLVTIYPRRRKGITRDNFSGDDYEINESVCIVRNMERKIARIYPLAEVEYIHIMWGL